MQYAHISFVFFQIKNNEMEEKCIVHYYKITTKDALREVTETSLKSFKRQQVKHLGEVTITMNNVLVYPTLLTNHIFYMQNVLKSLRMQIETRK